MKHKKLMKSSECGKNHVFLALSRIDFGKKDMERKERSKRKQSRSKMSSGRENVCPL